MNFENNQSFEQLQNLLLSFDKQLRRISAVQDESLRLTLRSSMQTHYRSLVNWEKFCMAFNIVFAAVFLLNYNAFIHDLRYFIPYLLIVACGIGNAIISSIKLRMIKSFSPLQRSLSISILNCEKYMLFQKREFIINTAFSIFVCIFAAPPICAQIKGWDYYQYNLLQMPFHLTVLAFAIVIAFGIDFWYYQRSRRSLRRYKQNIREYVELINE